MSSISFSAPRLFRLPGQSLRRAAGLRAGALFFDLHRDCFAVTRNFSAIYLDLVPGLAKNTSPNYDKNLPYYLTYAYNETKKVLDKKSI